MSEYEPRNPDEPAYEPESDPPVPRIDPETLMKDGAFMRRAVRGLFRNLEEAEEAWQEAVMKWFENLDDSPDSI